MIRSKNLNTQINAAIDKLNNISKELNDIFIEREKIIGNSIKALITGQAVLLIVPPRTAKSALTEEEIEEANNTLFTF